MSLNSDFWAALKKKEKEEKSSVNTTTKATTKTTAKTTTKTTSQKSTKSTGNLSADFWSALDNDIAPVVNNPVRSSITNRMTVSDIAPVNEKQKWYQGWFQKGALEDGYDFGDITKTILGTTADVGQDLLQGGLGIIEGGIDFLAANAGNFAKAQYYQNGGGLNVERDKAFEEAIDAGKPKIEEFTKKNLIDEEKISRTIISGDYEKQSVFADKTDQVVQSGGQLLATAGLQAVGVPWWMTTGATAWGGEVENALNQGATMEEANISGAISAGAEILTEKLSGGIKFGGKALDDALTDQLARGISNKFWRNAAKLGLDALGEGAEEMLSQDISSFGQWLTYRDEEELKELLFSEEAMDEKIQAFLGGAMMGGVSNVGNAIKAKTQGVDAVTGRTDNEEAVVRKVYEELVAEKGDNVTGKDKRKIYDQVTRELENGGISTDLIESLLDEEGYKAYEAEKDNFFKNTKKSYNEALASEEAELKQLQEELDKLSDAPNTVGNSKRYDAIVSRMTELQENPQSNTLRANLDAEVKRINEMHNQVRTKVHDMVKGTKLEESYNELIRSQQKYEVDVTKYTDPNARKTIENILKSGKGDNSNHFHEYADWLAQISADKGMAFDLTDNEALKGTEHDFSAESLITNGYKTADGIVLNMDSPKALNSTVGHEITHVLEQNTELYQTLQDAVFKYEITKNGQESFDKRLNDTIARYKGKDADAKAELTADLIGDYLFTDYDFVHNLSVENRNIFEKIYDEIKYLCKVVTAGSKEARELEKVKKVFEDAYRANVKGKDDAKTQHSLVETFTDSNGNSYDNAVLLDTDFFDGISPRNWGEKLREAVNERAENNPFILPITDESGNTTLLQFASPKDRVKKDGSANPHKVLNELSSTSDNISKLAVVHIDEIVSVSEENSPYYTNENNHQWLDKNGWLHRNANVINQKNGNIYNLTVDIAKAADGRTILYATNGKINKVGNVNVNSLKIKGSRQNSNFDPNVAQNGNGVKHSLSDSNGRELSQEQQDFFSQAKTRDEQGRLKPFFHGTARADRVGNVFDPTRATSGPMAFFTDNRQIADNYARDKEDTSLAYDEAYDDYYTQFRIDVNGKNMSVSEAWKYLPLAKKNEIRQKAKHITMDDDYENVIYDENAQYGVGGFDAYTINMHKGNILEALTDSWLESGTIYGEEQLFLDVLKLVGLDDVQYMNPDFRAEKTYEVYLNITNPFDTSNISEEIVQAFRNAAEEAEYIEGNAADSWDKRNIEPERWIQRLEDDIKNGTTHVWTSIPDFVTDVLKAKGYDGIFDTGGKGGGVGHTVAIPFYSKQIKNVDNKNPTSNPDIRYSLSENGKPKQYGDWNVYGSDFGYKGDFAPTIPTPNRNVLQGERMSVGEMFPDEPDIPQVEYDNLVEVKDALEARMNELGASADFTNQDVVAEFEKINEEWVETQTRLAELEAELSDTDRADSLIDAEAPPEIDAPYYESEPTTLTKKATADIVRDVRASLGLNNTNMADAKDIIERYRSGKIQTREQLVDALQDKFGRYTEIETDELLREVKNDLRTRKLLVPKNVQRSIADYVRLMRSNRGKIRFSKEGSTPDVLYKELNELYPQYYPIEMEDADSKITSEDALLRMIEIANTPHIKETERTKDIGNIEEAADLIINSIGDYKYNQELELSNRESKQAFESLVRQGDRYAPMDDIGPVAEKTQLAKENSTPNSTVSKTENVAPVKPTAKTNPKVAQVLTKGSKKPKQGGIWSKIVSAVVDKGAVFEKVSLDSGNMEVQSKWQYALPTQTEARAQYFMENGTDKVKSLKSIRKKVGNAKKANAFGDYLYHIHNIDRMTLDTRLGLPNLPVSGDTVTADVSRKEVARLAKQYPEFKQLAKDIYNISNYLLDESVKGGLISQETADYWRKKYPHFVPIEREGKNTLGVNVPLDTNKTGVNNPFKRAQGGNSNLEPVFNTIAKRIEQTYRAIARNSFGIELKNTLGTTITEQKNNTSADDLFDSYETHEEGLLKPGTTKSSPTFTVFENGKRVEFEITEDMYDALKPTNKILAYRNKPITAASKFRRNLLTVWNPVFALYRNPIKDLQDVAVNSQHPVRTYLNMPNAMFQIAFGGKYADEYHQNGGKSNTYFDSRNNKFKADNEWFKNTIGLPVKAIETAGEFIEEIPRLAEYIASRKNGRSVERSMLDAARVTTNFAAGGDFTKFLNSHGFTFLNASVQGAAQHVRNFRESAKRDGVLGVTKTLAKYVIAGVPAMIFNGLLWDDDEEYEELNDYVKQNYFVIAKTDEGKFIRIPKGRTTAVMHELMEQMQNLVTGDDEVDFATFTELFLNNIAPNNPLKNNIISPIIQAATNNAWYEGDIVPSRLQDLPAEEQFDESTDSISKWLGEKMGWSPIKINYLLDQYSGGLGDTFLPMLTPEAESGDNSTLGNILAPWKKEITTDSVLNNKNPGDFYDLKDELEIKSNSKNATDEDKMKSLYMDTVSWEMGDLYAQKREIQSSDLSDSEKYEQVRELQEQINELAKNATEGYNNVSIRGKYSEVGDKRFNYDAEKDTWYEIKPKNSDGTANWFYQMEQDVTKALDISYAEYWNNREEYNYAYEKPEQYAVAKATGGYESYRKHTSYIYDLKADKDENGESISGSKKDKVIDYINGLDMDYGEKIILFRSLYDSKADKAAYNDDIFEYLNGRDDITYEEKVMIFKQLGFEVDSEGYVTW